jgi:hypothetical protein
MAMETAVVQASTPKSLKAQVDAIIADGNDIVQIVETSQKSYYLVVYVEDTP